MCVCVCVCVFLVVALVVVSRYWFFMTLPPLILFMCVIIWSVFFCCRVNRCTKHCCNRNRNRSTLASKAIAGATTLRVFVHAKFYPRLDVTVILGHGKEAHETGQIIQVEEVEEDDEVEPHVADAAADGATEARPASEAGSKGKDVAGDNAVATKLIILTLAAPLAMDHAAGKMIKCEKTRPEQRALAIKNFIITAILLLYYAYTSVSKTVLKMFVSWAMFF